MAFAIEISEVGPAEYPLLEVLRESAFSEFGHHSRSAITTQLADRPDLLVLIAHLEGNPVGFSAGYRRTPVGYYINYVAILRDYRRQGIGRRLIERHEGAARSAGYRLIEFNTFNHFPGMRRLGLSLGFRPIGIEQHIGTDYDLAIRFGKPLQVPPTAADAEEIARVQAAMARDEEIAGVERNEAGQLRTILRSPLQSSSR